MRNSQSHVGLGVAAFVAVVAARAGAVTNAATSYAVLPPPPSLPLRQMRTPSATNVVASYTVLPGDTVSCIAMYHGMTTKRLRELNKKPADWSLIHPGDEVLVEKPLAMNTAPGDSGFYLYAARRGDTLSKIAHEHRATVEELREWNGLPPGYDKVEKGLKIRIAKRPWIDWNNPKLKILYEDYGLPRGNGDDIEVVVDFAAHRVVWSRYMYEHRCSPIKDRKLVKRHTHICGTNCWENVLNIFRASNCEEWEDYSSYTRGICDGGASNLTITDGGWEIVRAHASNASLPSGRYRGVIKGSVDRSFCIKSPQCDCKDVHWDIEQEKGNGQDARCPSVQARSGGDASAQECSGVKKRAGK